MIKQHNDIVKSCRTVNYDRRENNRRLKRRRRIIINSGSPGGIRSAFTYRKEAPRSLFRVHTWGGSVEGVTFTCEPQLAVVPLVLQQLPEFREHLPAVAADQYIWIAYDIPSIKPSLHCSTRLWDSVLRGGNL